ncbi:MAG: M23 family metallopeptidase [Vicinamibacterales bacterium]
MSAYLAKAMLLLRIPAYLLSRIPAAWKYEFRDVRLILEREGDLHYFQLSGRQQRGVVRGALVAAGICLITVSALTANNIRVALYSTQLERAQQETIATLATLNASTPAGANAQRLQSVKTIVGNIREQQSRLRWLLSTSVSALSSENAELWRGLVSSGVSDKTFSKIQSGLPAGGQPSAPPAFTVDEGDGKAVVDEVIRNRELKEVLRALPGQMPLADYDISSDFGLRRHPIIGKIDSHLGVDMLARGADDSVRSVAPGRVKEATFHPQYGNMVILEHAGGVETLYGHMASIAVQKGHDVTRQQVLGRVGNTGMSTGKHLHFEILVGGQPLDPEKVISAARNIQKAESGSATH